MGLSKMFQSDDRETSQEARYQDEGGDGSARTVADDPTTPQDEGSARDGGGDVVIDFPREAGEDFSDFA